MSRLDEAAREEGKGPASIQKERETQRELTGSGEREGERSVEKL